MIAIALPVVDPLLTPLPYLHPRCLLPRFATFLSDDMTYSCAYWKHEGESLQQAQMNKLDLLISKLKLEPHHTLAGRCREEQLYQMCM